MAKAIEDRSMKRVIVQNLLKAKEAYYNGEPTMTDEAFDKLEDSLRKLDPTNDYFTIVGASGNSKTKVKHEIPMLSCGKAKSPEEVIEWMQKLDIMDVHLMAQPKIDGMSCAVIYNGGKLVMVKSRGDGKVGQDITHIAAHVNIPAKITDKAKIEVRGELYIPKNTKYPEAKYEDGKFKPLRNIAVGLINRKDHGLDDLKFVKFVAYQVYGLDYPSENGKMSWLESNDFHVAWREVGDVHNIKPLYENYLKHMRSQWPYETDGLVFVVEDNRLWADIDGKREVSHHHHYNIALKPPSEGKETTLLGIEWNVSRQGKLIPVALVEPVELGGASVRRCTLNNYGNVLQLGLHNGDRVMIERANDVIPFFKENLTKHKGTPQDPAPAKCPSCDEKLVVDGIHLVCRNEECGERIIQQILHWVKACEMDGVAESTVRALVAAKKIDTIWDLYHLVPSQLRGLEGFGESKITNLMNQIGSTKEMTIGAFIDRLGIDLVGEKAMKKMGIDSVEKLWSFSDKTFVIGQNLIEYLKANKSMVQDLLSCVTIVKAQEAKVGSRNVCMTGAGPKTRNELIKDIEAKGDTFVDHVSKDTHILICEDIKGASSKLEKARKMGVKLVSYKEYFK